MRIKKHSYPLALFYTHIVIELHNPHLSIFANPESRVSVNHQPLPAYHLIIPHPSLINPAYPQWWVAPN